MADGDRKIHIFASDAGGTMTDLFVLDEEGNFTIGKASTTPEDESLGFWESLGDALEYWGIDLDKRSSDILPPAKVAIYSGTSMLNVLLTMTGRKVGAIVTRGFEDPVVWNVGTQGWAGYSYADTMHVATHHYPPELVSHKLIKGVTERVDMFGKEVIPLYEHEAEEGVRDLLRRGVDAIAVCFPYSYLNSSHECAVGEIAKKVMKEEQKEVPIYLSYEVAPLMREAPRLNTTVVQAYAAEPTRKGLYKIEKRLQDNGYKNPLQTVTASGGLVNIKYPRLVETLISGPIGGIMGSKFLADKLKIPNIVATDLGGTSFDVGLIRGGVYPITREVVLTQRLFNIPSIVIDSIGAGTGQYVTIDPLRGRLQIGPESAGSTPGPVCYDMGNETPTVMDCDLLLGILNPDYYLGGKLRLNKDKAYRNFKEKVADVIGMDVYEAAEAVIKILNLRARDFIYTNLRARGYTPADFLVFGYGGAGPMHLAGYTEGLSFKGVITVPFAAAFSSFGCTTIDYSHRYQRSSMLAIPPEADAKTKMAIGESINRIWDELEETAINEMVSEGILKKNITLKPTAFLRYGGQLDDLEVYSPIQRIKSPEDIDKLVQEFETLYERIYTAIAKLPQAGYQILEVGMVSQTPNPKPVLQRYSLEGKEPPKEASKGERKIYMAGTWVEANLFEMDLLQPGNEIKGPAVIEAPATTFFIPPNRMTYLDEYKIFWLK